MVLIDSLTRGNLPNLCEVFGAAGYGISMLCNEEELSAMRDQQEAAKENFWLLWQVRRMA